MERGVSSADQYIIYRKAEGMAFWNRRRREKKEQEAAELAEQMRLAQACTDTENSIE